MDGTRYRIGNVRTLAAALTLGAIAFTSIGFAQPPGGPPPGGGPGGPGGFGPGGRGGPGMGFGRPSLSNLPVGALDAELKLSDTQKRDIKQIQDATHKEQRALMPRLPGGPNGRPPGGGDPNGGPPNGPPPDFEQMRANMEKVHALDNKAVKQIESLLTDAQKKRLPDALKELNALGPAGIPLELLGDLKLSSDQKSSIVAVSTKAQRDMRQKMEDARRSGDFQSIRELMRSSRDNTRNQVMAILTPDQKALVENFEKDHPMRGRGGFPGGPGGFPGGPGGFGPPGGGPPPGGGSDGPPPPDEANGPPPPDAADGPPPADAL